SARCGTISAAGCAVATGTIYGVIIINGDLRRLRGTCHHQYSCCYRDAERRALLADHFLLPFRWLVHGNCTMSLPEAIRQSLLGSGLVHFHNQKMIVAASAMADKKTLGHLS